MNIHYCRRQKRYVDIKKKKNDTKKRKNCTYFFRARGRRQQQRQNNNVEKYCGAKKKKYFFLWVQVSTTVHTCTMTLRAMKNNASLLSRDCRPDFMVRVPITSSLKSRRSQALGSSISFRMCRQVRCREHFSRAPRNGLQHI